ncbi:efflux RND transporter permease subunit [Granulicella cerasi]|uniref:efflux RND transporter permease subunit n=1 Tax=Granulicella cerasi TaxID=741063 RepID=UPI0021E0CA49|nr:efflux RND transporter permease subunit [Granulicella cerasi]
MSFENPQPGDSTPHDAPKPGDYAKAHDNGGPSDRAGAHAPEAPHVTAQELNESDEPVGGVHFSAPFIKRPVATFLLSIAIIIAGCVAYKLLPVSSLPQVEFPVIAVGAQLPGADPTTMASSVATPLERQFSRIAGVNEMTSTSSTGSTSVILQFDLSRDINGAARDVQAAINAARAQLPANLPSNPTYRKINPADSPILILALTSDNATRAQMYDASDSVLAQKIAQVDGVGQVFTGGSAKPAVRIEANPYMLTSFGLSLDDVRAAMTSVNVLKPTGYINGTDPASTRTRIATTDQITGAAAYRPLIIATNRGPISNATASTGLPSSESASTSTTTNSSTSSSKTPSSAASSSSAVSSTSTSASSSSSKASTTTSNSTTVANFATSKVTDVGSANEHGIVRLSDVASVVDEMEDIHTMGLFNGKPAILVVVFKSPGANVIETVDNVLKQLPALQASIRPDIKLQVVLDRTLSIRASLKDVERTMIISILLVVLVVFVFLREGRSTVIPSVSVPLSLLGTFGVMWLLGYTLDNLSLMALTISTGFVVDDAIVVIENIMRHLEMGKKPFEAAMIGSKEIGFTVLSMSISLIAVFIPILLMPGIIGRLFREFAVTLSVAIAVSLVVSLTTTPMLSGKFLKEHKEENKGWFYRTGEKHLAWLTGEYERGLQWVLRHKIATLVVFLITFALNIYLFIIVPKGFFPEQDTGRLQGQLKTQQDTSFNTLQADVKKMASVIEKDPQVENTLAFVGSGGPGGGSSNTASMFIVLKDAEARAKAGETADKIITRLRPQVSHMPGTQMYLQSAQELRIGGRSSATMYQYTLTADTTTDLDKWSPLLMAEMQKMPELKDIATDQQDQGLEAHVTIDRDTASRLGVSALAIDSILSSAYGQRQVSTVYGALNQYHVVLEVAQPFQQSPEALRTLYVKSKTGAEIPLSAITKLTTSRIPLAVNHQGLSPAATLSFNLSAGYSLGQATDAINAARVRIGVPSTVKGGFAGTAQAAAASFKSEPLLILFALFTVYIVLGVLYESFIHPLTILSTLPSAGVGALLALLLFKIDLSVIAMIGIILLIGIVKKNAIMMIDFALVAEREHGKTPEEAIYEACLLRFRPIMMTTMAALLGAIPLAFGTGTGSELRVPLGVTIIGGLIVSQCLTLFTTPVIYLVFEWIRLHLPLWRRRMLTLLGFPPKPHHEIPAHGHPAAGD